MYIYSTRDLSWMTVALYRIGFITIRDSLAEPIKLVGETETSPNFKTHRSRTWDLNQALHTVQRENQRDQSSNQRILFDMVYIHIKSCCVLQTRCKVTS